MMDVRTVKYAWLKSIDQQNKTKGKSTISCYQGLHLMDTVVGRTDFLEHDKDMYLL
jgi:hypothetical protein